MPAGIEGPTCILVHEENERMTDLRNARTKRPVFERWASAVPPRAP